MYVSLRNLSRALVLCAAAQSMSSPVQAQPDVGFIESPRRTGLEQSTWSGQESGGDESYRLTFEFGSQGDVMRTGLGNVPPYGNYRVVDGRLVLSFNQGNLVYVGEVRGSRLVGTVRGGGRSWNFEVGYRTPPPLQPFSGANGYNRTPPPSRMDPNPGRLIDLDRQPITRFPSLQNEAQPPSPRLPSINPEQPFPD